MMEGHSLALQDVAIAPSALAGARADAGIQAPSGKLVIQVREASRSFILRFTCPDAFFSSTCRQDETQACEVHDGQVQHAFAQQYSQSPAPASCAHPVRAAVTCEPQ